MKKLLTIVSIATALVLFATTYASAATLTVTKLADTNDGVCDVDCSLREAVTTSNNGDEIVFQSGLNGVVVLDGESILIDHDLVITGSGSNLITISGNDTSRVFYIEPDITVSISNLTVSHGYTPTGDSINTFGAGIANNGHLTVSDMVFSDNIASHGGAISNGLATTESATLDIIRSTFTNNIGRISAGGVDASTSGFITVKDSTFIGNIAQAGEAGALDFDFDFSVENSTFIGNIASGNNGGGGAIYSAGSVGTITNSTFFENQITGAGYYPSCGAAVINDGGGVIVRNSTFVNNILTRNNSIFGANASGSTFCGDGSTITIENSIIIGGTVDGAPNNCEQPILNGYNNIESGTDCGFVGLTDQQNIDPFLDMSGPHDNGGGLVYTIALLEGSPAINAGDDNAAPETDARGFARVGVADIGAYEYGAIPLDTTPPDTTITPIGSFPTTETSSSFILTADEPATFECSLDSVSYVSCSASYTTPTLAVGTHILAVRAIDASDNVDASPATYSWTITRHSSSGSIGGSIHPIKPSINPPVSVIPHLPLPVKYHFIKNLSIKMTGEDIRQFQIYLNTHGFPVSPVPYPGSLGHETTLFGPATRAALIKFQIANKISPSIGFFGPITRGWVNSH